MNWKKLPFLPHGNSLHIFARLSVSYASQTDCYWWWYKTTYTFIASSSCCCCCWHNQTVMSFCFIDSAVNHIWRFIQRSYTHTGYKSLSHWAIRTHIAHRLRRARMKLVGCIQITWQKINFFLCITTEFDIICGFFFSSALWQVIEERKKTPSATNKHHRRVPYGY